MRRTSCRPSAEPASCQAATPWAWMSAQAPRARQGVPGHRTPAPPRRSASKTSPSGSNEAGALGVRVALPSPMTSSPAPSGSRVELRRARRTPRAPRHSSLVQQPRADRVRQRQRRLPGPANPARPRPTARRSHRPSRPPATPGAEDDDQGRRGLERAPQPLRGSAYAAPRGLVGTDARPRGRATAGRGRRPPRGADIRRERRPRAGRAARHWSAAGSTLRAAHASPPRVRRSDRIGASATRWCGAA